MFPLAIADSIDALAVGVTFAFRQVSLWPSVPFIGLTTFLLSAAGVWIGNRFGAKYKSKAELAGGIVLIGIGFVICCRTSAFWPDNRIKKSLPET